jgi:hypothetical protein
LGSSSVTISEREFGMPITVSTNSPSMNILPSTSRPSPTKNAVTASRSATVMPTWSKRIGDTGKPPVTLRQGRLALLRALGASW